MVQPLSLPANGFVRVARKVYNPLGFSKGYNFVLWFIFAGALFGFTLARAMYLNIPGVFCGAQNGMNHAAPGECFYYQNFDVYKIGIRLHLYMIIPAALLVVIQFTPAVRYKAMLFHRMNGYTIIVMSLIANAGALMIARHAFGGTFATQSWIGFTAMITTGGLGLAYYNIKRLQIDQHRAWMIRTWFYFASIITLRIIMAISATIISTSDTYYLVQPCDKLASIFNDTDLLTTLYPACTDLAAQAIVHADMAGTAAEIGTALNMTFGMAGWLALALHAVGVEIYLHLTPRESQRLRQVSYQRQLEAHYKNPGNGGLTPQRLGDANAFEPTAVKTERSTSGLTAVDSGEHLATVTKDVPQV